MRAILLIVTLAILGGLGAGLIVTTLTAKEAAKPPPPQPTSSAPRALDRSAPR
jgi:hypothetical protein